MQKRTAGTIETIKKGQEKECEILLLPTSLLALQSPIARTAWQNGSDGVYIVSVKNQSLGVFSTPPQSLSVSASAEIGGGDAGSGLSTTGKTSPVRSRRGSPDFARTSTHTKWFFFRVAVGVFQVHKFGSKERDSTEKKLSNVEFKSTSDCFFIFTADMGCVSSSCIFLWNWRFLHQPCMVHGACYVPLLLSVPSPDMLRNRKKEFLEFPFFFFAVVVTPSSSSSGFPHKRDRRGIFSKQQLS